MRREFKSNQWGMSYATRSGIQNTDIQKLLSQAIVNCMTGNRSEVIRLCELAATRQSIDINRDRLHASIGDILKSKGREVTITICQ